MIWILAALVLLAVAGFAFLQQNLSQAGPVLAGWVDRITGGTRGTARLASETFGPSQAQTVLVYGPKGDVGETKRPVILFIHGGGWHSGSPEAYDWVARALVPEGFVVVLAGYRMHPEAHFPAMLEDTASAIVWTRAHIADYGGDPEEITLVGHSAGAYNVVMSVLDRQYLAREGLGDHAVRGVIGLAGPYDFYPFDSDSTRLSFGEAANPADTTQPVAHVRGDAPPMLLMHGADDTLVLPPNSPRLAGLMAEAGGRARAVSLDGMGHYAIVLGFASPWRRDRRVIDAVIAFARDPDGAMMTETSVPVHSKTR